jgi:hypothetical protein
VSPIADRDQSAERPAQLPMALIFHHGALSVAMARHAISVLYPPYGAGACRPAG